MKTASLALPMHSAKSSMLDLVMRYLPHIVIIVLVLGVLALASYGAPSYDHPGPIETHLGQHL